MAEPFDNDEAFDVVCPGVQDMVEDIRDSSAVALDVVGDGVEIRIEALDNNLCRETRDGEWEWTQQKYLAATMLAGGVVSKKEVRRRLRINSRTLVNWLKRKEFNDRVADLVMKTGLALEENQVTTLKTIGEKIYDKIIERLDKEPESLRTKDAINYYAKILKEIRSITGIGAMNQAQIAAPKIQTNIVIQATADKINQMGDDEIKAYLARQNEILDVECENIYPVDKTKE